MGWDPTRLLDPEFLILSTHGGLRAENGEAHRARLSHRPLGSRPAGGGSGARAEVAARHSLRRGLHRSLRRPHAGHDRHDGLAALSQRCRHRAAPPDALAAHRQRRDRHRHLRQGSAGDDDGAGVAGGEARRAGSRRRHAAARVRRGRGQGADHRRALCAAADHARSTPPRWAAAPARRPAAAASFWARRPRRRWSARRWGCRLPHTALAPSGQPIWLDAARRSARALLRLHQLGLGARDIADARGRAQRHGAARGLRRIDQSADASARHCLRGGIAAAHSRRLGRGQSPGAAPCGCAAQRPAQFCHGAGVSCRRRA